MLLAFPVRLETLALAEASRDAAFDVGCLRSPEARTRTAAEAAKGVQDDSSAKVAHTFARSSNSSQSERKGKRSLRSKSIDSMQARSNPRGSGGLLSESPLLLERFRQPPQSGYPLRYALYPALRKTAP
jgi:hypothetical protein